MKNRNRQYQYLSNINQDKNWCGFINTQKGQTIKAIKKFTTQLKVLLNIHNSQTCMYLLT